MKKGWIFDNNLSFLFFAKCKKINVKIASQIIICTDKKKINFI